MRITLLLRVYNYSFAAPVKKWGACLSMVHKAAEVRKCKMSSQLTSTCLWIWTKLRLNLLAYSTEEQDKGVVRVAWQTLMADSDTSERQVRKKLPLNLRRRITTTYCRYCHKTAANYHSEWLVLLTTQCQIGNGRYLAYCARTFNASTAA